MKKERAQYGQSKPFWNYLISFIGIFLLLLGILGVWIVGKLNRNMWEEEARIAKSKLYTIVQDMEKQLEAMNEVTMKISSFPQFRFENLKKNKYQEIEMLESLKQYHGVCQFSEFVFIKYQSSDMIFMSTGQTQAFDVYLDSNFDREQQPLIREKVNNSCIGNGDRIELLKQGSKLLFLYSLDKYSYGQVDQHAVLCFQVSENSLQSRMETIVGPMSGVLHIHYKNNHLLGDYCYETESEDNLTYLQAMTSSEGNFTVWYDIGSKDFSLWGKMFSKIEIAVILCCLLFVLIIGFGVAWWNYMPIRRLVEKLGSEMDGTFSADWSSIEGMVESLLKGNERDSELLKTQYQMLREQTVQLILSGGYSKRVQEYMTILNIRMDAAIYGIVRCVLEHEITQEKLDKSLYGEVKELAGEGISLYPCWDKSGDYYVLVATEERYQVEEISELLRALFEAKEIPAKIDITAIYKSLKDIGKKSEKDLHPKNDEIGMVQNTFLEENLIRSEKTGTKQNTTVKHVIRFIDENCTNYELSLDLIAQNFQVTPSYLCRIIKQETGKSYKEYLTGLRIEIAKHLLSNPAVSVIDVCQQIGYSNVSHFIKVFQKYTGVTPAKYRDEL